ncbi:hypothetical protein Cni_G02222 [Canna indica]|uniref:Uncharacterized protein n=1 Tax=Canna indica TaxID=4628 RepID=A0AAQ3JQV6_9LILI|nr:hypothetical protein Cni_G02222 [Canna indica]
MGRKNIKMSFEKEMTASLAEGKVFSSPDESETLVQAPSPDKKSSPSTSEGKNPRKRSQGKEVDRHGRVETKSGIVKTIDKRPENISIPTVADITLASKASDLYLAPGSTAERAIRDDLFNLQMNLSELHLQVISVVKKILEYFVAGTTDSTHYTDGSTNDCFLSFGLLG